MGYRPEHSLKNEEERGARRVTSSQTMATIRAIDRDSIKRICSGQVVVDLATAVKEMVENSLDAGATTVEVKVKECGAEWIEVSDNGIGIDPSNYASIALKHHTSKLCDFADLNTVASFGFRGEALNALCELSGSFTVTTKQASEQVGTRLAFGKDGSVQSEQPVARTTGTTVTVNGLFEALPVRRGEFVRSIKKQYQKMVKVLQSYAIIAVGVRLVVTNITKGSKQIVIGTTAGNKMSDNISTVVGSTFMASLIPLSVVIPISAADTDEGGGDEAGGGDGDHRPSAGGFEQERPVAVVAANSVHALVLERADGAALHGNRAVDR
jgi:DNA mismatch repair protein PMS2